VSRAAIIALTLGSALLGAVCASAVVLAFGDDAGGSTATVLVPFAEPTSAAATSAAVPQLGNGFDPAAIYARRAPGVVTIYAELGASGTSQGSGFVVDDEGRILTNAHVITNVADDPDVVAGAERLYVEFPDGERVSARIVGWDLFNDTGVIEVDPAAHRLQPVPLGDSDAVRVGDPVAAIGSPFGKQASLAVGVVSATGRTIDSLTAARFAIADAIQTDAPINRGNSGGPLLDARGRVIGINAQIQSQSGNAEGVGFAVPINSASRSLRQLVASGAVRYAYVGIESQDVTPGLARTLGLGASRGALVARVTANTPAARAGLRPGTSTRRVNGVDVAVGGDLIVGIGAAPVRSSDDVGRLVATTLLPGQKVVFHVVRDGKRIDVPVTLADRPTPAP
jgi:S1-C subfamily serine protease